MLRIKLAKSVVANTPRNRATVAALGLHRTGAVIYHNDTPAIRGMIHKVKHLLVVEENVEMPNITIRPTKAKALARKAANKAKKADKPAAKVAEKPAKAVKTEKAPAKPAAKKPAAKTTKKEAK